MTDYINFNDETQELKENQEEEEEEEEESTDDTDNFVTTHFSCKQCQRYKLNAYLGSSACSIVCEEDENSKELTETTDDDIYDRCICGTLKRLHKNADQPEPEQWDRSTCIKKISPTNTFGSMVLMRGSTYFHSKYVRVADDDSPEDIFELMVNYWKMFDEGEPDIIISLIGSNKTLKCSRKNMKVFTDILISIGQNVNALIIYSGLDSGWANVVSKYKSHMQTENAFKDKIKFMTLGIVPWSQLLNPLQYEEQHNYRLVIEVSDETPVNGMFPPHIDCNYFIMVDDGYRRGERTNSTDKVRATIEKVIKNTGAVVAIAEGGDYTSIVAVAEQIRQNIHVVVLQDTGKAAELIYEFYLYGKGNLYTQAQLFPVKANNRVVMQQYDLGCFENQEQIKETIEALTVIFKQHKYIHFSKMDDKEELQIIPRLLSSDDPLTGFRLMMKMKNSELAKEILKNMTIESNSPVMNELMTEALIEEDLEFIQLLLEYKINIQKFNTVDRLQYLYSRTLDDEVLSNCLKYCNIKLDKKPTKKERKKQKIQEAEISEKERIGSPTKNIEIYMDSTNEDYNKDQSASGTKHIEKPYPTPLRLYHINKMMQYLVMQFHSKYYELTREKTRDQLSKLTFHGYNTELFLWSVLRQRKELALFFWYFCDDRLFLAIFASSATRVMAQQLPISEETKRNQYNEFADYFEDRAILLLQECSIIFPDIKWLVTGFYKATWQCLDIYQIAHAGNCQRFMGTIEMQDVMYRIWTNQIESSPKWIFLAMLFPPLIASKRFVNYDKRVLMTSKQIAIKRIPANQIADNVGNDTFEVRQHTTYCRKFFQVYSSVEAKFTLRVIAYIPFLLFATYTIFYDIPKTYYSPAEIVLFTILISQFLDIMISTGNALSLYGQAAGVMLKKFPFFWYELVIFVEFLVVVFLRVYFTGSFKITKTFTGILLLTLYFRIFIYARFHRKLGPFLTTIKKMFFVTLVFTFFIFVVMIPSGVTQQALLFPHRDDILTTLRGVFFFDYYRLYGDLALELTHGELEGCAENDNSTDCPTKNNFVPAIVAVYMLFANIFLINVLIAVFSNVIEETENKAIEIWKFNAMLEISQYRYRWILPPPFSLIELFVRLFDFAYFQVHQESLLMETRPKPPKETKKIPITQRIDYGEGFIDDPDAVDDEDIAEHRVVEALEAFHHAYNAVQHRAKNSLLKKEWKAMQQSELVKAQTVNENTYEILRTSDEIVEMLFPTLPASDDAIENIDEGEPETPHEETSLDKVEEQVNLTTQGILELVHVLVSQTVKAVTS